MKEKLSPVEVAIEALNVLRQSENYYPLLGLEDIVLVGKWVEKGEFRETIDYVIYTKYGLIISVTVAIDKTINERKVVVSVDGVHRGDCYCGE